MANTEKSKTRIPPAGASATENERKALGRLEAFSDGVFAIAITLLVLEIQIPHATAVGKLSDAVEAQWPAFVAYIISFMTILVMWLNHHNIVQYINRADRLFFIFNGLLLMVITFVNYPTALVAEAAQLSPSDQKLAALIYSGTLVVISLLYNALWLSAIYHRRLIAPKLDQATIRVTTILYSVGIPLYGAAFLLALVSPVASLALNAALALYFVFTSRIGGSSAKPSPRRGGSSVTHSTTEGGQ